jgi:glycosyltransferase involved in cell wall biosynthesis
MAAEPSLLHVVPKLTMGGAGRSLLEVIRHSQKSKPSYRHDLLSLEPGQESAIAKARTLCGKVMDAPDENAWGDLVRSQDLILLHYWNTPCVQRFLRAPLPRTRLVLWLKVMGNTAPHVVTPALLGRCDRVIATCPTSLRNPVLANADTPCHLVPGVADFTRLGDAGPKPHRSFNVGYIGTVDFVKLHGDFTTMSSAIRVPELRVIVCGSGGAYPQLKDQARRLGTEVRFEWQGHVENIGDVLSCLDVFGYPLCEDTYATSEKSLQEAMYAGVPPVVFPHGGIPDLVQEGHNGLVVTSGKAYAEAIDYLYHHPEERQRLGRNAAQDARNLFDPRASMERLYSFIDEALSKPAEQRKWITDTKLRSSESQSRVTTGAQHFIESLGEVAPQFAGSVSGEDEALFAADRRIVASSPVLVNAGAGGILHYRSGYPDDPFLRFWAGLVLNAMDRHALALAEFSAAARLGFSHWRIHWYIAEAARLANAHGVHAAASERLERLAPGFDGSVIAS